MSALFERLLAARGLEKDFLAPRYEDSVDPFLMVDMEKAVGRVAAAVQKEERVLIYGDYDVDGVTASAALYDTLKLAGIQDIDIMLPNRFTDGYGMSKKVVQKVAENNEKQVEKRINLVFTVDCGSRNYEIVEELNEQGVETVITDHHECGTDLPKALAVVNPKRAEMTEGGAAGELRDLAGVGVVFKLAQALAKRGMIPEGQEKWLLDLVTIGTICDSMKLTGENRRLCRYGFLVLEKTRRPGLKELLLSARANKLDSETIGFQVGPRLNAAGRMDSAERALELLMAKKRSEAAGLTARLEELNRQRKQQQNAALKEIEDRGLCDGPVIVEVGKWHEGVLGIIAGRLTEEYHKPAFALAEVDGVLKGSGRSFGDFNLAAALDACRMYIEGGGGHAGACGVKVAPSRLEEFRRAINEYYKSLGLVDQERFLTTHEDVIVEEFGELSLEFVEEMRELEPYGEGNLEPIFLLPEVRVVEAVRMGAEGEHLRLTVWDKNGKSLKLMKFYAPEEWRGLRGGETISAWITLTENTFRGIRSVEGRIVKIK